jgi:hypothetical protein
LFAAVGYECEVKMVGRFGGFMRGRGKAAKKGGAGGQ